MKRVADNYANTNYSNTNTIWVQVQDQRRLQDSQNLVTDVEDSGRHGYAYYIYSESTASITGFLGREVRHGNGS